MHESVTIVYGAIVVGEDIHTNVRVEKLREPYIDEKELHKNILSIKVHTYGDAVNSAYIEVAAISEDIAMEKFWSLAEEVKKNLADWWE